MIGRARNGLRWLQERANIKFPNRTRAFAAPSTTMMGAACLTTVMMILMWFGLTELFGVHGSLTRLLDEDSCLAGVCQTDANSGLCSAVHDDQSFVDVGDRSGFRLSMINDLHDDRLAMLWEEDCERGRRRRAAKIGYLSVTLL